MRNLHDIMCGILFSDVGEVKDLKNQTIKGSGNKYPNPGQTDK